MNQQDIAILIDSLRNRTDVEETTIHAVALDMVLYCVYPDGTTALAYPEQTADDMVNEAFRLADMINWETV